MTRSQTAAGGVSAVVVVVGGAGWTSRGVQGPMPAPGSCHFRVAAGGGQLSDPRCTPGATDPAVTPGDITSTICRPGGYTAAVRPPERITEQAKKQLMAPTACPGPRAATTSWTT